jgi:hypothetical protein
VRPKSRWDGPNRTLNISEEADRQISEWALREHRSVPEMMRVLLEDIVRAGLLGQVTRTDLTCPRCGGLLLFDVILKVRQKTDAVVRYQPVEIQDRDQP